MNFLHAIHPSAIAFHVGALTVHWYGIILSSAFIIGFFIASYTSKQKQVDRDHLYNLFLLLVVFGLIGGRIAHVITEWGYYQHHFADVVKVWQGGLAFHGVVFAGLITTYLYCRVKKISFWLITDVIIVAVPLMQALGRWGNYFNQELFGKPTSAAWGIPIDFINRPTDFQQFSFFHPLFLYESFFDLVIFAALFVLFRKNRFKTGRLTLLYFILYSVVRFSLDFLRLEPASIGPLSWGQWVSIVLVIGAVLFWFSLHKKDSVHN
jgi:phosphatidylglycerol---prolipoprotein diacylglyceryl transferase